MCVCYLRGFSSESVYKTNRKRANPRFRIAAIYPSVNIQPLMKTPKIDIQQLILVLKTLIIVWYMLTSNICNNNPVYFMFQSVLPSGHGDITYIAFQ